MKKALAALAVVVALAAFVAGQYVAEPDTRLTVQCVWAAKGGAHAPSP